MKKQWGDKGAVSLTIAAPAVVCALDDENNKMDRESHRLYEADDDDE